MDVRLILGNYDPVFRLERLLNGLLGHVKLLTILKFEGRLLKSLIIRRECV